MTDSKHTPGPWFIGCENDSGCEVIAGPVAFTFDRVPRDPGAREEHVISREEMLANARLCAAAPDLLAAAREALETLDQEYGPSTMGRAIREQLRAAIAEAEPPGRAPSPQGGTPTDDGAGRGAPSVEGGRDGLA